MIIYEPLKSPGVAEIFCTPLAPRSRYNLCRDLELYRLLRRNDSNSVKFHGSLLPSSHDIYL